MVTIENKGEEQKGDRQEINDGRSGTGMIQYAFAVKQQEECCGKKYRYNA